MVPLWLKDVSQAEFVPSSQLLVRAKRILANLLLRRLMASSFHRSDSADRFLRPRDGLVGQEEGRGRSWVQVPHADCVPRPWDEICI